jgi:exopolyphosphatase / guanosine-5'-triphosphate,3'-diphosphate pyrophosphatase
MKLAAIDIGSNGIRLLICRPLELKSPSSTFKKVELTRLPLRLGDDVFNTKNISKKKADLLLKAMQAFSLLMEIYNVDGFKACATSAMRDAQNAEKIIQKIFQKTGIPIHIISGIEESRLIIQSFVHQLNPQKQYLHIDVGGGSTEISLIIGRQTIQTKSFNIGTIRLKENQVKQQEWNHLNEWLSSAMDFHTETVAVGTGGNINKLFGLSENHSSESMSLSQLEQMTQFIKSKTKEEKIYTLQMNPDRAEVIDYAGDIYVNIMKKCHAKSIIAPNKGLKDGIIHDLWIRQFQTPS